jgi:hypothetical protein
LLCTASGHLKGPSRVSQIRDVLVDLRGFVDRVSPGTPQEHDGLFHDTFGQHLLNPAEGQFVADGQEARGALVQAIAERAPREGRHDPTNPVHRYAAVMEPQLLWELGRREEAGASLAARESPIPMENLARWRSWETFLKTRRDGDDLAILATRSHIADWIGETGDAATALTLFTALLRDQERALRKDHPDTLETRSHIARWTGETGDARKALKLYKALLRDQERVLRKDHPDKLTTRSHIAYWTAETGDASKALTLFNALLPDQERTLGKNHPDTLTTRSNIAHWTAVTGDARKALDLFTALLRDQERVLGKDHTDTRETRSWMSRLTERLGQ